MNADVNKFNGKWHELKNEIRHRWRKFTVDDLYDVQGDSRRFIEKLQERYGYARARARRELDEFMDSSDVTWKPTR